MTFIRCYIFLESCWDTKAAVDTIGLVKKNSDPTYIVSFRTVHLFFRYLNGLNRKLQDSSLDCIEFYKIVTDVQTTMEEHRNDEAEI